MKYDAFISYRHGGLDGLVAEKLHRMLETYRVPGEIAKKTGKRKLSRVFRDREELPTSSNLSDSINDALENSEFLILICSRRTKDSLWVLREVERFAELHGRNRIVTLLTDGEPEESFPPGLLTETVGGETVYVEPLAADIRAESAAKSLKLLKDEKLRLLAPILGCGYDDLKQRHRRRRLRRIAVCVGAAFALTFSFGAFSTYQYILIDREMQLKLENQSHVLAEYAGKVLADGDPDTALLLALAALPGDPERPDRPLVRAAEKALADALGVYDASDGFAPHRAVALPAAPGKVLLSPGETRAAAVYPFAVSLTDTETGQVEAVLPTLVSALADAEFLSDDILVYAGEDGLAAHDIPAGRVLWRGSPVTEIAVAGDGSLIAALSRDGDRAYFFTSNGREAGTVYFGGRTVRAPADDTFLNPHDTIFELNGDGSLLAVSFADGSLSVFGADTFAETGICGADAGVIHFSGGFSGDFLAFSVVGNDPYRSSFSVWDSKRGEITANFESDASRFIPFAGEDGLYFAFEDQIFSADGETGRTSRVSAVGGRVENFKKYGGAFIVCGDDGSYRFVGDGVKTYASEYVCNFTDIGARFALTGSYDSPVLRILKNRDNAEADVFSYGGDYAFSEARLHETGKRALFYSYRGFRLLGVDGIPIRGVSFPEPARVTDTQYDAESGNLAVLYDDALRVYAGDDGRVLLEAFGKKGVKSVTYTPFGAHVLEEDGTATLYDFKTARAAESARTDAGADFAVLIGGLLSGRDGRVFFDGEEIGAGNFIGGAEEADGGFVFALASETGGSVYSVRNGRVEEAFPFETRGRTEAYFSGGYVFVSPLHGAAAVYDMRGKFIRDFSEDGYMTEVQSVGGHIVAGYISASSERRALLLDGDTLETVGVLPGFSGAARPGALLSDIQSGRLRAVNIRSLAELISLAEERLRGRTLTEAEKTAYRAG